MVSLLSFFQNPAHHNYRRDIDGLRAIAVVSVVFFHAFPHLFPGGFIGVDIFFVISGYLITQIILRELGEGRFSLLNFYSRRIRRIFPALFVVLVSSYAAGWLTQYSQDFRELGKHIAAGAAFISNIMLITDAGYFNPASEFNPMLHLWSLAIEEQFYIVWPSLLIIASRFGWTMRSIFLVLIGASFIGNLFLTQATPEFAFFFSLTRFWELLVGAFLAGLPASMRSDRYSDALSGLGLALIIAGFALIDKSRAFPGHWALLPVLGAACLLHSGPGSIVARRLLARSPLVAIGLISYPLYLWHWPLLVFLRQISGSAVQAWAVAGIVVLAFVLATLTYLLVERPFRFGPHARIKTLILIALMAIIGIFGLNAYQRDGLRFRPANKGNPLEGYNWREGYRHKLCLLDALNDKTNRFDPVCIGKSGIAGNKLVMLWGDSHAASLYPGLKALAAERAFDLAQFNASGCPPVFGFHVKNRPECRKINDDVRVEIERNRPDTLVMAGFWSIYDGKTDGWNELDDAMIEATIRDLGRLGVKHTILVGPLPAYHRDLPRFAAPLFKVGDMTRSWLEFDRGIPPTDDRMLALARRARVTFVSPLDLLCNEDGCLVSASSERFEPVAWDRNHLTEAGARLLMDRMLHANPTIFPTK
jgi:peptidoglycan/LPS O-acetylase OafA/YrhL